MSSISKKIKNIFKNKIVLYSVIAVTVIAIGIVVWGAVTDWKFWNAQKKSPPPKIPDYPIKHSCHPRFCKKCDISGERCEKGGCIEGTENINGYCFKPQSHPCSDKKCAECSKDGKKCETCASGYVLDKNGKCCSDHEKINGVCCVEPCGGKCCPKGKICMKSKRKNLTGCCLPSQSLDNDGNCCPTDKIDDAGNCCNSKNDTLCGPEGNKFCCGNSGPHGENTCEDNICRLKCGTEICTADQNCELESGTKKCIDKTCEWDNDQIKYYPKLTYSNPRECKTDNDCGYNGVCEQYNVDNSGKKKGLCQYYPIGVVPNNGDNSSDFLQKNVLFEADNLGNPYLFLFPSTELGEKYRFSKVGSNSSKTKKQSFKCTVNDCRAKLGSYSESETVYFNSKTGECLVEEETAKETISPSSDKICPFKDKTRCCTNENGNWSGQICSEGNACVYDKTKQIGTCAPKKVTNNTEKDSGLLCGTNDTDKGSELIKYDSSKQPYCDCPDKKLNSFNCVLPPECKGDNSKSCNGHGVCLYNSSIIKCSCDRFWTGSKCETLDKDACRKRWTGKASCNYKTGVVDDNSPYVQILSHCDGQTCSSTGPCKDDCCGYIKDYCGCYDGSAFFKEIIYPTGCGPQKTGCTACSD